MTTDPKAGADAVPPLPGAFHIARGQSIQVQCDLYTASQMQGYARDVRAALASTAQPSAAPAERYKWPVTECEACLTEDACRIRGQCAHYLREEDAAKPLTDTMRLDWLGANPRDASIRLDDGTFKAAYVYVISADRKWTIREAIDAALVALPEPAAQVELTAGDVRLAEDIDAASTARPSAREWIVPVPQAIADELEAALDANPSALPAEDLRFDEGLTVAQLKPIVAAWPEVADDGEACGVWVIDAAGLSFQVIGVGRLNVRSNASGREWADLYFEVERAASAWGRRVACFDRNVRG